VTQPLFDIHGRPMNMAAHVLSAEIEEEIQERNSVAFLPDEYRKLRKQGYSPEDIDYDMCHVSR
jgi:hypothetical protein